MLVRARLSIYHWMSPDWIIGNITDATKTVSIKDDVDIPDMIDLAEKRECLLSTATRLGSPMIHLSASILPVRPLTPLPYSLFGGAVKASMLVYRTSWSATSLDQ